MAIKLTELPAGATPTNTDLLLTSQNIGTTPTSDAITFSQVQTWIESLELSAIAATTVTTTNLIAPASSALGIFGAGSSMYGYGTFTTEDVNYTTGTASQSGVTVTGVGTTFSTAMIGGIFTFSTGDYGVVIAVTSTTSLTLSLSQTVSSTTFNILYGGVQQDREGYLSCQHLLLNGSPVTPISTFAWTALTTTTVSAAVNNGYIATGAILQTFTIPATFAVGDIIEIADVGGGGIRVAQNASQNIRFGASVTTTGTGGHLDSTAQGDTLRMIGTVANTSMMVLSSVGNITVT